MVNTEENHLCKRQDGERSSLGKCENVEMP